MKKGFLILGVTLLWVAAGVSSALAALTVRVQPSGADIPSAYVLSSEARTYFGNVEGGTGAYEYMWEFSNGGNTAWANVTDPNYIAVDGKLFGTSGLNWARLTVRDKNNLGDQAAGTIQVQVLSVDTANRRKNSAIDNGLRRLYRDEQRASSGSYWGWSYVVGETAMAMIAFENHGHNLEAPDSDIYKKSVQEGLRYLFNQAQIVELSVQFCIGDPEGVPGDAMYDDQDLDNDGIGVAFPGSGYDEGYVSPLAMLAIVNSCTSEEAKIRIVAEGPLAGQTYWDVMVDAKDFLAYAQTDNIDAGGWQYPSCSNGNGYFQVSYQCGSDSDAYMYSSVPANCETAGFKIEVDYGADGAIDNILEGMDYCDGYWGYFYPSLGTMPPGNHRFTGYFTSDGGQTWNSICSIDVSCESQAECPMAGWRYERNYNSIDNSVSQWPTLALEEAQERWQIHVNPQVREKFKGWLAYSQDASGGFAYDYPGSWVNFPKTGAGLAMLKWAGYGLTDANVQAALSYLDVNWDLTCYDGNLGSFYGMYAFYKGMKYLNKNDLNGRDWESIYATDLIARQDADGYFHTCGGWIPDPGMSTSTALAILAPAVAGLPPVADAGGPYGQVAPGQNVPLDGSGSFHQDPMRNIVAYQWDFDASNGLWWDTAPAPAAGEGATGITADTSYPDTGSDHTYTVTLRVIDDSSPVQTDTDTATVMVTSGNVPPVAQTNGPWAGLPGDTIVFDGSSSYDPNSCTTPGNPSCLGDSIVSYEWDLDGDGTYNEAGGDDGTPVVPGDYSKVQKTYATPVSQTITLRVTDNNGLSGMTSPQVNIVAIALVYGQDYNYCFRQATNRFVYRQGVAVLFKNMGTATAENVVVTLTNVPTNLTILKGTSNLGDMDPGDAVTTQCDPVAMTADIELQFDRRITPTGSWSWSAEFDYNGTHYILNNLPPLGP